jgi:glycine betaine/proline transport system substrate-binding protein
MSRPSTRGLKVAFVVLALGVAPNGCSAGMPSTGDTGDAAAPLTTIHLVYNAWDASQLDAAIAQILLTEQMGVDVPDPTLIDEYAQWDPIAAGDQHASFEVWPSGHAADIKNYVDTGKVENGGLLGPVGKISWYIPTYLLTTYPMLASWQAYQSPEYTTMFATPETGQKGRFLGGDPTWTQYDADIITNLGLNLQVVMAGSEQAELAELDSVYNKRGAILLYLWSPHSALAKYDLTAVALPPYSDACYANAPTSVACDYPADHLFKILWPGLATANPKVHQFLRSFTLTTADQIQLLGQVDNLGQTIPQAARGWVDANTSIWQTWIPQ